ncbi:MAG: NHL repeat-containing protein [Acidobacteriota bacterium]
MHKVKIFLRIFAIALLSFGFVIQIDGQKAISEREPLMFKTLFPGIEKYIKFPVGIEVDKEGNYYILEREEQCIKVFKSNYNYSHKIGEIGQGKGELYNTQDFCLDKNGTVFVADSGNRRIQYFSSKGQYLGGFNVQFRPRSIKVNSKGEIYVTGNADLKNNTIISVFNKKGEVLRNFGNVDAKYKDDLIKIVFNKRTYLDIDQEDNVYITFEAIPKFRKYDKNEKLIFEREIKGPEIGRIMKKAAIPIADHKKQIVSNIIAITHDIRVDENGNILIALGAPYIYQYNREGNKEKVYHCYYSENGGKKEIGLFKIFSLGSTKILGTNPFTNCIISNKKIKEDFYEVLN